MQPRSLVSAAVLVIGALAVSACSVVPSSGPNARKIESSSGELARHGIELIDLNASVTAQLETREAAVSFANTFASRYVGRDQVFGSGDVIEVIIWEAAPAALFGTNVATDGATSIQTGSRETPLPTQVVNASGNIFVPFIGAVRVAGRTATEVEQEITRRLAGTANHPQVLVRTSQNATSTATVLSDAGSSVRVPLTPKGETVLDALSAAGGAHGPIGKISVQLTRGGVVQTMPLESVLRDPSQNVKLHGGDIVALLSMPYSFTALGATGKNEEISFEAKGISLTQALGRTGGLNDSRSDPKGVFIFRQEGKVAADGAGRTSNGGGAAPVIYRVDMTNPASFFLANKFMMRNGDIMYVANSPIADLQKFLNIVFSVAYPVTNAVTSLK
ncbi:polysaccharide export protein [Burkholderia cenocepacia]|uniref:polysaccharide biosynthesis/export family protein n=1 Tax=Burkholderia cenocepacia TaxID=95486 RepID=UPI001CF5A660|nr:polysaccharide biosynthesis/export family protein [Burkholderia cenocepacia]MCA8407264.1 polysaccharide export protein [Burkholderia cenocepacia]